MSKKQNRPTLKFIYKIQFYFSYIFEFILYLSSLNLVELQTSEYAFYGGCQYGKCPKNTKRCMKFMCPGPCSFEQCQEKASQDNAFGFAYKKLKNGKGSCRKCTTKQVKVRDGYGLYIRKQKGNAYLMV